MKKRIKKIAYIVIAILSLIFGNKAAKNLAEQIQINIGHHGINIGGNINKK